MRAEGTAAFFSVFHNQSAVHTTKPQNESVGKLVAPPHSWKALFLTLRPANSWPPGHPLEISVYVLLSLLCSDCHCLFLPTGPRAPSSFMKVIYGHEDRFPLQMSFRLNFAFSLPLYPHSRVLLTWPGMFVHIIAHKLSSGYWVPRILWQHLSPMNAPYRVVQVNSCISFYSRCSDQMPGRSNLRKGEFVWGHGLGDLTPVSCFWPIPMMEQLQCDSNSFIGGY